VKRSEERRDAMRRLEILHLESVDVFCPDRQESRAGEMKRNGNETQCPGGNLLIEIAATFSRTAQAGNLVLLDREMIISNATKVSFNAQEITATGDLP
jgi:hypothetical protein